MSIKQLKDGRYQVDVRPQGAGGRRIRKIFTLKSKAQEFERYVLQNFHNNPWQARPAGSSREYPQEAASTSPKNRAFAGVFSP